MAKEGKGFFLLLSEQGGVHFHFVLGSPNY